MTIFAIGRNYAAHAAELGNDKPTEPVVFIKSSLPLHNPTEVRIPAFTNALHHEIEFVLSFRHDLLCGTTINSSSNIFNQIAIGIDFTARDLQDKLKAQQLPWEKAKSFAGSCVLSSFKPFDSLAWRTQKMELFVNGSLRQTGDPTLMLFSLTDLVKDLLSYFDIRQGDLLFTGTPSGVSSIIKNDHLTATLNGQEMLNFRMV